MPTPSAFFRNDGLIGGESDLAAVRRPDRTPIIRRLKGKPREIAVRQIRSARDHEHLYWDRDIPLLVSTHRGRARDSPEPSGAGTTPICCPWRSIPNELRSSTPRGRCDTTRTLLLEAEKLPCPRSLRNGSGDGNRHSLSSPTFVRRRVGPTRSPPLRKAQVPGGCINRTRIPRGSSDRFLKRQANRHRFHCVPLPLHCARNRGSVARQAETADACAGTLGAIHRGRSRPLEFHQLR